MGEILRVEGLSIEYRGASGRVCAVNNVSFSLEKGSVLGVVGESGSGKSTVAHAIMGLLPEYAVVTSGKIIFDNKNILEMSEKQLADIRGKEISMIFQEPGTALNPVFKIGEFMVDVYQAHNPGSSRKEALTAAIEALRAAAIPSPEAVVEKYPHELSGGMKQRVLIATAIMNKPKLLIADEPTSALDVSVQAQILALLKKLQKQYNMSILFITHNLAVAAQISDRIAVMYAGSIMEIGPVEEIFEEPKHPYTRMLMKAIPRLGEKKELEPLPGSIPTLSEPPNKCVFHDRCPNPLPICRVKPLPTARLGESIVYCWRYGGDR